VYSYDTLTGEVSYKEVTATFVRESDHINYLTIVDENGNVQVLETTDGHPFWVVTDEPDLERAARSVVDENGAILYHHNIAPGLNGFWVEAKDLREGDVFLGANGELSTVVSNERIVFPDKVKVYNFMVDGNHNYFVIAQTDDYGQTCILVHNANQCAASPNITIGGTLERIKNGQKHPHKNDGTVFQNKEGLLPPRDQGFYREYVHQSLNITKPGKERIIIGRNGDVWFSPDHYLTFIKIRGF